MATEIKRARQRESRPLPEFCAIEARASTGTALGEAPIELRNLGVTQGDLAEMTGLPAEIGTAIRAGKNRRDSVDEQSTETISTPPSEGDTRSGNTLSQDQQPDNDDAGVH